MSMPTPKFAPMAQWLVLSGMSRTASYNALGRGDLQAIKVGARTLIDVEGGLAWLHSLPRAQIRAPKAAQAKPPAELGSRTGGVVASRPSLQLRLARSTNRAPAAGENPCDGCTRPS